MAWSKVKTIIIAILALLNLFLLFLVAGQQFSSRRYESDTLRQTVEALALNGINLSEDVLPGNMELSAQAVSRNEEAEASAANLLLTGDIISTSSGSMSIYSSVSGNVSFQNSGDFSATLHLDCSSAPSRLDHASALLGSMGAEVWGIAADGDTVTVVQAVNGAPAFNVRLTLTYSGNYLVAMEGKLLLGSTALDSDQSDSLTVPTALVSLLEYIVESGMVCRSINAMTPGYLTTTSLSDPVRLTPCWFIETDTANYYLDAATGTVTRAG